MRNRPIHSKRRPRNRARTTATCAVVALATGGLASVASAQDEWWEDSPYYEEDAWWDVTEWFDGNNYNPALESADDDWDWGTDWDYDYNSGSSDEYALDDYDTRWYGYNDRYDADDWFYDYWDEGYSHYRDQDNDGIYEYSYSYYDYDNDGLYDAYYSYHDWDDDGIYEDTNYYTFGDVSLEDKERSDQQQKQEQKSRSQRAQGKVLSTKTVSVRDTQHLVARVEKQNGETCLVDLGPAGDLDQFDITKGSQIQVRGPMAKAGNKNIIIARRATVDGNSMQIQRDRKKLRGQVASTKRMNVRGDQHLFAILATGQNKRTLVDLGPADRLDVDLQQDDQIQVRGVPVKVNDRRVLIASELQHEGNTIAINRMQRGQQTAQNRQQTAQNRQQRQQRQQTAENRREKQRQGQEGPQSQDTPRQVNGEVVSTQKIKVRGNERQTATIKNERGKRLLVDLGSADTADFQLQEGDRIRARGALVRAKDGKPVMLATAVKVEDQGTDRVQRNEGQMRSITGEITGKRTASVRDQQRQLARVEAKNGETFVVDLGTPDTLATELNTGDTLTARGSAVKAGNQLILVAREIEHDGETITIHREKFAAEGSGNRQDGTNPDQATATGDQANQQE